MPPSSYAQAILDNMRTAVMLIGDDLRVLEINQAVESLFAMSKRRIIGCNINDILPGGSSRIGPLITTLVERRAASERGLTLTTRQGKNLVVNFTSIPVVENNQAVGTVVEIQPIAMQQRISKEEKLLVQHDWSRNVIKGMAHEIKNPLGGMRGAAQILQRSLTDPREIECTDVIIDEIDRLSGLINRMLGPNSRPQMEMNNLHEVVEKVIKLVEMEVPENISIARDYDPSIPDIYCDSELLQQALLNIAKNAIQAIDENNEQSIGKVVLQTRTATNVTVGNKYHRLTARIVIQDNGPGIPPDMLDKIFYPMVTRRDNGTGLGLSISQSIVNQHHGLIECHSEPGKTKFVVHLPIARQK